MAEYTAIADVSETLLGVLRDRIADREDVASLTPDSVSLVAPDAVEADSETRLSLSLYRIEENGSLANTDANRTGDPSVQRGSPLALDLYYLVTSHSTGTGEGATGQTVAQQRLLGLAMQTFHDHAVLSADQLGGSFDETAELQVSLVDTGLDERSALWSRLPETAFTPSAIYHVGPVFVDSRRREEITPVTDRETDLSRHSDS
ncbi:DUF4255 domain-containing protein [Halohasta salina]|uniref:DUF4255 domain-containing protein n=1 Tax=Halohasta salina TaxID=2961621 RepID=UPI0020A3418B|nr:DUF4255 domain-containing protein [Halohasta salina]